ncbi:MAG: phosphate ABC transporter substrate-binding protein [Bacteroidota bacterium]
MRFMIVISMMLVVLTAGCSGPGLLSERNPTVLRIKGSDSMALLTQRLAEAFMKVHPDISVYAEGGGTGDGISAMINGSIDIASCSRPLSSEEVQQLASQFRTLGVSVMIARDALSIIVHPSNGLTTLTYDHIEKIYTGDIVSWNDAGSTKTPIVAYSREPNSGTYVYFEEHVLLGKPFGSHIRMMPGAQALVRAVAQDSAGIGYSTSAYIQDVKTLAVDGITPSVDNVRNGTYPIARYFYLYTPFIPEGNIKIFIDWVISEEGQDIVQKSGYIPLYDLP